jgi:aryl-alcohol dehydrogenase-like predicted oxidoreductase
MALMQGLLSGRFASFDDVPAARTRTRHFSGARPGSRHRQPGFEAETAQALRAIGDVASEVGLAVSDLALAWALASPAISCTIVGCRNVAQLEDNLRAAAVRLSRELKERLDRATDEVLAKLGPGVDYYQSPADARAY